MKVIKIIIWAFFLLMVFTTCRTAKQRSNNQQAAYKILIDAESTGSNIYIYKVSLVKTQFQT